MTALSPNAARVLVAAYRNIADCTSGEFGFSDEVNVEGVSKAQKSGYFSALAQKGLIEVCPGERGTPTQTTPTRAGVELARTLGLDPSFAFQLQDGSYMDAATTNGKENDMTTLITASTKAELIADIRKLDINAVIPRKATKAQLEHLFVQLAEQKPDGASAAEALPVNDEPSQKVRPPVNGKSNVVSIESRKEKAEPAVEPPKPAAKPAKAKRPSAQTIMRQRLEANGRLTFAEVDQLIEELGVRPSSFKTAYSDLKNPKYAKGEPLNITKTEEAYVLMRA